jgi:phenylacetate-CoA ligase
VNRAALAPSPAADEAATVCAIGAIGSVPLDRVIAHARDLSVRGGLPVPDAAAGLTDLPIGGPAEILAVGRTAAERGENAIVMSSGGTTGRPKLTYVPYRQALGRLLEQWRPLNPDSVLLNLFNPGRLWASHYYMHALAERSRCTILPSGPLEPREVADWLTTFKEVGVDAVAGTPTVLADFARGVLDAGETLPVKTLIWMAEPWTEAKRRLVREAFPEAGFWGNYGSVETYVIATNTPACDGDVLHLMPEQLLEPDPGGALLTRVGEGWTVPTVRYRLGDLVGSANCRCGRPDGLRVLGRADDAVKFFSSLTPINEILELLRGVPGVQEAQIVLDGCDRGLRVATLMSVHYLGDAPEDTVMESLLAEFYDLRDVAREHPGAIAAHRVDRLERIERTGKVAPAVWRAEA